ncbi:MAG: hypothetical protein JJ938_09645 [Roseicyclus sp.]|uniref:hypothetical protein n=1 Tax=Boseongicola sp. H5 TaxID=2763261 RepID=UPI001B006E54|nr:hypothetical protein [Boseongicola sp. H5]MBO6603962.1 hypothetical protein [Roseicyclus sp.]MBO6625131.1 hypothetical protein [Roseicyclus sp.]MBO6923088.1 hypothetical protein [Roseicyclus sp.]
MIRIGLAAAGLALTACAPGGIPERAATTPTPRSVTLDEGGVQPSGTPLRIDFGRAQDGVIETMTRLQGAAPVEIARQTECGPGPVTAARWQNGLTLNFLDGDFRGWTMTGPDLSTPQGIFAGMARADLPGADFSETSLGTGFRAGGIFGILDERGSEVRMIWAGATCFQR